jgi:GAF domain
VAVGEGLIGTVARERRVLRISGLDQDLAYCRAVRRQVVSDPDGSPVAAEIPLPGLQDARSALVIPLAVCDHLVGVLAAESRDPVAFDEWHEAYLEVLGNQIALGLERMSEPGEEREAEAAPVAPPPSPPAPDPATASSSTGTTTASSWTGSTSSATCPGASCGSCSSSS